MGKEMKKMGMEMETRLMEIGTESGNGNKDNGDRDR